MPLAYSVIIPFYNEEDNIPLVMEQVVSVMDGITNDYEIIAVDDGSTDNSFQCLKNAITQYRQLKIIKLRRNFGQTPAIQAGIDHAKGERIITMDGDLQNDPKDFPLLIKKLNEGYDVVSG